MNNRPLVCVCMITYGHEKYIRQSIESILMQQTNFEFNIVVANDCSPDKTNSIIEELINRQKATRQIEYIAHENNIGMYANFIYALSKCNSKYIALCEGDDFWTDPLKLQKQVDFLEANPDYEVCFTNINIINDNGDVVKDKLIRDNRKTTYVHENLPIWAPTLTRVFRNRNFNNVMPSVPGLDTVMLLYQSKFGKIKFINEITGTYRLHDGGIYSAMSEAKRKEAVFTTFLGCLDIIDATLLPKYFGLLFKKLVEIRILENDLFISNRNKLRANFKKYSIYFSFIEKIKIQLSFLMISIPFLSNLKAFKTLTLKVLNRFFIY